jgi:hypothetical protein
MISEINLESKYQFKAINHSPLKFDLEKIPRSLHILIPFVKYFVSENLETRETFMRDAPLKAFVDLDKMMTKYSKEIDIWLGGDESLKYPYSKEYLYFSILQLMSMEYLAFRD